MRGRGGGRGRLLIKGWKGGKEWGLKKSRVPTERCGKLHYGAVTETA